VIVFAIDNVLFMRFGGEVHAVFVCGGRGGDVVEIQR
jgi:hypothetical protein